MRCHDEGCAFSKAPHAAAGLPVQFVDELYAHAQGGATLADPAALAATQRDLLAGQGCDALSTVCAYRMWVR